VSSTAFVCHLVQHVPHIFSNYPRTTAVHTYIYHFTRQAEYSLGKWKGVYLEDSIRWLAHKINIFTEPLLSGFRMGLETGDLYAAAKAMCSYCSLYIFTGRPLTNFVKEITSYARALHAVEQDWALSYVLPYLRFAENVSGDLLESFSASNLNWETCRHGKDFAQNTTLSSDSQAHTILAYAQLLNAYIMNDLTIATSAAEDARRSPRLHGTHFMNTFFMLLDGLYNAQIARQGSASAIRALDELIKEFKARAKHQTGNCIEFLLLLQAERASLRAKTPQVDVKVAYERAIEHFQNNQMLHLLAISTERYGEYLAAIGETVDSEVALRRASLFFAKWGAETKTTSLAVKYPIIVKLGAFTARASILKTSMHDSDHHTDRGVLGDRRMLSEHTSSSVRSLREKVQFSI
jgi:hypothetical protein